jgi:hypothetical protein
MREVTTRNGDTVNTDIDVERRWIPKPRRQMVAPLIDRDDIASTKLDLKAPLVVQTARAVRRARANRFLQGFYGNAYTGEVGTTAVPFKAANVLAAGGVGITKNKLISLKELISTRLVDDDEMGLPLFIITAKQVSDLLKINELVSRDYNPLNSDTMKAALLNGVPTDFMGFTFMKSEIGNSKAFPDASTLTVNGSSERLNPVFFKQGIHKGVVDRILRPDHRARRQEFLDPGLWRDDRRVHPHQRRSLLPDGERRSLMSARGGAAFPRPLRPPHDASVGSKTNEEV